MNRRPLLPVFLAAAHCVHRILRAPRRIVGQAGSLRRIVNPPAALGRARRYRGESPPPRGFAAMRGSLASCARVGNRRVANPPDPEGTPTSLPHERRPCVRSGKPVRRRD